ncbi:MAG: glycosyltransferase [Candidatus Helarchaeota archaeon]
MDNRTIDVGITAYNEEENINNIIDSVLAQKLDNGVKFNSILVVASGCTDRTEELVLKKAKLHPFIKLISEKKRKGKASAMNLVFQNSNADILIFIGADEILPENSLNELIKPFKLEQVGAVSGFPIALNNIKQNVGYASCLVWKLHDLYSQHFKTKLSGELFAIRPKIIKQIPTKVNCDDALIEVIVANRGYKIAYARKAKVFIMGPQTVSDYLNQRKRVKLGHMQIKKLIGHKMETISLMINLKLVQIYLKNNRGIKNILKIGFSLILEIIAQINAYITSLRGNYDTVWKPIKSAKILKKIH